MKLVSRLAQRATLVAFALSLLLSSSVLAQTGEPITHPGGNTTVSGPDEHEDDYAATCTQLDSGQKVGVVVSPTEPYEMFTPGDTGPAPDPGSVFFDGLTVGFAAITCDPAVQQDLFKTPYQNFIQGGDPDHDLIFTSLTGGTPFDNCPNDSNTLQQNSDPLDDGANQSGDACDANQGPPLADTGPIEAAAEDVDEDGDPNTADNCPHAANPDQANSQQGTPLGDACDPANGTGGGPDPDTDDDGVPDAADDCDGEFGAPGAPPNNGCPEDPGDPDADGDGVLDDDDDCPNGAGAGTDTDGDGCKDDGEDADDDDDGVEDGSDDFPLDPTESEDTDGDGVGDNGDNCQAVANAGQEDADSDGVGDACEEAGDPDGDGDGVPDATDNCLAVPNAGQEDADSDGTGDACEEAVDPDGDADGVPDATDNCPADANAGQANNDGDVHGDACDADDDNDGVADSSDGCPLTAASTSTGCVAETTSDTGSGSDAQTDTSGSSRTADQQQTDGLNGIDGANGEVLKAIADTQAPAVAASVARKLPLRRVIRRGLKVALTASEPATVRLALLVSKRTAKRVGLRKTQVAKRLTTVDTKRTVTLTLTKRARRALRKLDRVTFKLRIAAMDATGNAAGSVRAIRAR